LDYVSSTVCWGSVLLEGNRTGLQQYCNSRLLATVVVSRVNQRVLPVDCSSMPRVQRKTDSYDRGQPRPQTNLLEVGCEHRRRLALMSHLITNVTCTYKSHISHHFVVCRRFAVNSEKINPSSMLRELASCICEC